MKIIIGIILIYIILVVSSAWLMRFVWNTGHKGTELEETWTKSLKTFAIGYFIVGIILMMIFSIFHFCF
jgi:hypothetical protein